MTFSYVLKFVLAFFTFASFFWGASRFFLVKDEGAKKGKTIITLLGFPSTILNLYFLAITENVLNIQNAISIVLYILSSFIFWSSIKAARANHLSFAFSKEKPTGIVRVGPYRFIRHPFYLSYTLAWLAGYIGTNNLILLIITVVMFLIYLKSALQEEKVILESVNLKDDYSSYKKTTGMFFPKIIK